MENKPQPIQGQQQQQADEQQFAQKKKIYTAMIDRVLVKNISELTQDDLKGENPDIDSIKAIVPFLESIYNKKIQESDTVSVVYFSEIIE